MSFVAPPRRVLRVMSFASLNEFTHAHRDRPQTRNLIDITRASKPRNILDALSRFRSKVYSISRFRSKQRANGSAFRSLYLGASAVSTKTKISRARRPATKTTRGRRRQRDETSEMRRNDTTYQPNDATKIRPNDTTRLGGATSDTLRRRHELHATATSRTTRLGDATSRNNAAWPVAGLARGNPASFR